MKPSVLRNLMLSFLALGLVMGAVFPIFANLFVEWKPGMLLWFVVSALLAGAIVGLANYWLVNLVPAFLNVGTTAFVVATMLGIAPATVVFSSVGSGLGAVLDRGGVPDLSIVFEPHIMGPLLGLAVLALVPVILRRFKKRRVGGDGDGDV